jgi:hypothetical protein
MTTTMLTNETYNGIVVDDNKGEVINMIEPSALAVTIVFFDEVTFNVGSDLNHFVGDQSAHHYAQSDRP